MSLSITAETVPIHANSEGVFMVGGTRVTLDIVVAAFNEGATAEEIVHQYPVLSLADVYAVISYYLRHRSEVDSYMMARQQLRSAIRRQNERLFDPIGIRERLIARLKHKT